MYELITYSSSIFIIDYLLSRVINNRIICWYIIHAYCNFYVVYKTIPYILIFFNEPLRYIQEPNELQLHHYAVIPHLYHCIAFKLNYDDIFHHLFFVFFALMFKFFTNTGMTIAFYLFFINGVPGGIDYIMLTLYKLNMITKHTRHKIALYLNAWFRCPGIIFSNSLFIVYTLINEHLFYKKVMSIIISLLTWSYNGLYYNYMIRDSYIIHYQIKQPQN